MINIQGASGKIKVNKIADNDFIIDIDETYSGQVSLNTLGMVTTGLWEGEIIQPQFGGTGLANNGVISIAADVVFTGSLLFDTNPEFQTTLKITDNGTIALEEKTLQTANCFAEFTHDQKQVAFDAISPLQTKGSILSHNGKNNVGITVGLLNQFLGVNNFTGLPEYQFLPNIYSYIVNDSTNYNNATMLPVRRVLNFCSDVFIVSDCDQTKRTLVKIDSCLESLIQSHLGLLVKVNDCKSTTPHFTKRKLVPGANVYIKNADFIDGNPVIGIANNYKGQPSINTLGKIKNGSWEADVIEPQHGGTGYSNQHKMKLEADVSIDVETEIEGIQGDEKLSIGVYRKSVRLIAEDSGIIATKLKTLQCEHNLGDIQSPAEAFRHISPTKTWGDIIVRGPGDWDIPLSAPKEKNKVLTSDSESLCGLTYKSLDDIEELHDIIKLHLDKAIGTILKNSEKIGEYVKRLVKAETLLNDICSQLDHMVRTKQMKPIKQLQDALDKWVDCKLSK